jgi:RimJ/RimL family protein N-acetyltransferase
MVRDATVDDVPALADLHVRAWRVAYQGFIRADILAGLSVVEREKSWQVNLGIGGPFAFTLVEETPEGAIAGFCSLVLPSRDDDAGERTAELGGTYVDPGHWQAGVGRALVEVALARLEPGAWDEMTLWVFKRNAQARAFYARLGFRLDGAERVHEFAAAKVVRMRMPFRAGIS